MNGSISDGSPFDSNPPSRLFRLPDKEFASPRPGMGQQDQLVALVAQQLPYQVQAEEPVAPVMAIFTATKLALRAESRSSSRRCW